jgi:cardiolipin synthase
MKYKFYTNSEKAWLAMLEDIKKAKKSIYIESFILTEDSTTKSFFDILKQKACEGIRVKIIVDRLADLWYGSVNKDEFKNAGAEILFFNRWWFYRTHRKILIVDEEIAFLGGVNVRGEYAKWGDLHVRLTGLFVKNLLNSFSRVYELSGGRDRDIIGLKKRKKIFKARAALYRAKSWLIERWPIKGRGELKKYYKRKIKEAQSKITIVTPYFFPHGWLIKSLKEAARRGVRIEVLTPEHTDVWLTNIAHRVFVKSFRNVINFFFIREMNHAKVLLIDDREGLVGSNNIDAQSFDFNLEAAVIFQRKDMVGDLKKILERWKKEAIPGENIETYHKWYHRFMALFIKFFQPIL